MGKKHSLLFYFVIFGGSFWDDFLYLLLRYSVFFTINIITAFDDKFVPLSVGIAINNRLLIGGLRFKIVCVRKIKGRGLCRILKRL